MANEIISVSLNPTVFEVKATNTEKNTNQVVFDAVQVYMSNRRQATAKTKTRAEVRGGGKKPWRQKGTGRARAGSSRSPLWVGGGTVFGPDGRQSYKLSMNKKAHALALRLVLSAIVSENNLVVVDSLEATKTKEFVAILNNLNVEGKALIVLGAENENVERAARNIPGVKVVYSNNVSVYDLLNSDKLVCTNDAIEALTARLATGGNN